MKGGDAQARAVWERVRVEEATRRSVRRGSRCGHEFPCISHSPMRERDRQNIWLSMSTQEDSCGRRPR
jgi:hypothetical protein